MGLKSVALTLLLFSFSSCFKKDNAIVLPPPGQVQLAQLGIGPSYEKQAYFQLASEDSVVNKFNQWDIAFDASANGYHIWVNGGNMALAANTNRTDFNDISDTTGLKMENGMHQVGMLIPRLLGNGQIFLLHPHLVRLIRLR